MDLETKVAEVIEPGQHKVVDVSGHHTTKLIEVKS